MRYPQLNPSLMFTSILDVCAPLRPRSFPDPYLQISDQVFTRICRELNLEETLLFVDIQVSLAAADALSL